MMKATNDMKKKDSSKSDSRVGLPEGKKKVIIIGAAGRDFHNFNVLFRDNKAYEVVAFTAAQIPFIADRKYPSDLSGKLYPNGIPISDESNLQSLIGRYGADVCVQSYSDVPYKRVMNNASLVNAAGSDFWLVSPERTMIKSSKPVIAVCAVRTGCGKSQTSRYVASLGKKAGKKIVAIRHPMPYGNLSEQAVQRYANLADLDKYKTTVEEREDYEPHIKNGTIIYSGVDYERILRQAEAESDVVLWDGGNNDTPFIRPDLMITVADPLRAGDELNYYPGETSARMADILLINKANSASKEQIDQLTNNLKGINPRAKILLTDSVVSADKPDLVRGKKVMIIEDGPTITHGGLSFGAGTVAAKQYGAGEIVEAKKYAVGTIRDTFDKYPHLKYELPAMGYSDKQVKEFETTINNADCEVVLSATPADLAPVLKVNKPVVTVSYELKPRGNEFDTLVDKFIRTGVRP